MKNAQLVLNSIQTALLVSLVVIAARISRQLPAQPDNKARAAMESQIPLVNINNWPAVLESSSVPVDVDHWPDSSSPLPVDVQNPSLDVDIKNSSLDVDVQNSPLSVDVETLPAKDTLDVNVVNWPDSNSPLPVVIYNTR